MFSEPNLEPPWVNDSEWEENLDVECEVEVDSHPDGVACNEQCAPEDGNHMCSFVGTVSATCVGQTSYTAYYTCPQCGTQCEEYLEY